ncbi:hypothetical protein I79_023158 [Cricetulus griseus]|uniref:Uncharacterized protein n=1 Tax=Cricetulus griseus TaxID=10029 RepID=G3IH74_CRIGR|nr:hypothetical protein I79_023158 [Cricetulus griseus]
MQKGTGDGSAVLKSQSACRRVKTQEAGFLALPRTQQKHQVPNDENLQIESKLIQVIPYGEGTKGKRSI